MATIYSNQWFLQPLHDGRMLREFGRYKFDNWSQSHCWLSEMLTCGTIVLDKCGNWIESINGYWLRWKEKKYHQVFALPSHLKWCYQPLLCFSFGKVDKTKLILLPVIPLITAIQFSICPVTDSLLTRISWLEHLIFALSCFLHLLLRRHSKTICNR